MHLPLIVQKHNSNNNQSAYFIITLKSIWINDLSFLRAIYKREIKEPNFFFYSHISYIFHVIDKIVFCFFQS